MRILIIDDHADAADSLGELLQALGHEVEVAHTGKGAVERALRFRPHVIFCDLAMPEVDGLSVCQELRRVAELQDAVAVAWTGFTDPDTRRRAEAVGFAHYLVKPTGLPELMELLTRVQRDAG